MSLWIFRARNPVTCPPLYVSENPGVFPTVSGPQVIVAWPQLISHHMKIAPVLLAAAVFTVPPATESPTLVNTCLITDHVAALVDFYQAVLLQPPAVRINDQYAEFHTGATVLAIFSAAAQEGYIPGSAHAAQNASVILEFRVPDVDKEFARLQPLVRTWVKPPANTPWGTRSAYFRDPDGNLVDFYARAR